MQGPTKCSILKPRINSHNTRSEKKNSLARNRGPSRQNSSSLPGRLLCSVLPGLLVTCSSGIVLVFTPLISDNQLPSNMITVIQMTDFPHFRPNRMGLNLQLYHKIYYYADLYKRRRYHQQHSE